MARSTKKPEERAIGEAVFSELARHYGPVTDKNFAVEGETPDLNCLVNGRRVCIELTGIYPTEIRWKSRQASEILEKNGNRVVRVMYPFEPHMWLKQAIERKSMKLAKYKRKSKFKNAHWGLVVHSPLVFPFEGVTYSPTPVRAMLINVASGISHGYDFILFCTSGFRVFGLAPVVPVPARPSFKTLHLGYPVCVNYMTTNRWDKGLNEDGERVFDLDVPEECSIDIAPTAPEFAGILPQPLPKMRVRYKGFPDDGALESGIIPGAPIDALDQVQGPTPYFYIVGLRER